MPSTAFQTSLSDFTRFRNVNGWAEAFQLSDHTLLLGSRNGQGCQNVVLRASTPLRRHCPATLNDLVGSLRLDDRFGINI